ncbi:hypothetical protein F5148DRAFT_1151698 [Russula earlei]|uniref:Uncharacterized protein n=1 Tax=Russula earlei TaxID=71964 RepID=A0ACC0TZB3_9AGAM|nr:hypothetical protein F5148DRAFT_1151698 [Russula earlei]
MNTARVALLWSLPTFPLTMFTPPRHIGQWRAAYFFQNKTRVKAKGQSLRVRSSAMWRMTGQADVLTANEPISEGRYDNSRREQFTPVGNSNMEKRTWCIEWDVRQRHRKEGKKMSPITKRSPDCDGDRALIPSPPACEGTTSDNATRPPSEDQPLLPFHAISYLRTRSRPLNVRAPSDLFDENVISVISPNSVSSKLVLKTDDIWLFVDRTTQPQRMSYMPPVGSRYMPKGQGVKKRGPRTLVWGVHWTGPSPYGISSVLEILGQCPIQRWWKVVTHLASSDSPNGDYLKTN